MFMVQQVKEINPRMLRVNEARKKNYEAKRVSIIKRFNELINLKMEGIRLDFEGVITKLAAENYLSEKRLRNILKTPN